MNASAAGVVVNPDRVIRRHKNRRTHSLLQHRMIQLGGALQPASTSVNDGKGGR